MRFQNLDNLKFKYDVRKMSNIVENLIRQYVESRVKFFLKFSIII